MNKAPGRPFKKVLHGRLPSMSLAVWNAHGGEARTRQLRNEQSAGEALQKAKKN